MVAWKKKLECIKNLHLTERGLNAFGFVIDFVKNNVLEFSPPKEKINYTDSFIKLMLYKTSDNRRLSIFGWAGQAGG